MYPCFNRAYPRRSIRDDLGRTAVDAAIERGYTHIQTLIEAARARSASPPPTSASVAELTFADDTDTDTDCDAADEIAAQAAPPILTPPSRDRSPFSTGTATATSAGAVTVGATPMSSPVLSRSRSTSLQDDLHSYAFAFMLLASLDEA